MKDNLFEMLLNLFEQTLAQLKESHETSIANSTKNEQADTVPDVKTAQLSYIKAASDRGMRVFTYEEQLKLTKASYQFLMRAYAWGVLASDTLELVLDQVIFSESRFIALHEIKWMIRNVLANNLNLNASQLAFLDLVLYHREDKLPLH